MEYINNKTTSIEDPTCSNCDSHYDDSQSHKDIREGGEYFCNECYE